MDQLVGADDRPADDIAAGEDARVGGAHLLVDFDPSVSADDPGGVAVQPGNGRPAADCQQDLLGGIGLDAAVDVDGAGL